MALVECPDCGKWISDQANECNQCGRPMEPARTEAEESTERSGSPGTEPVKSTNQFSKLPEDFGNAVGAIGAGVGIVVIVLHSLAAGLLIAGIAIAAGLWIQYGGSRPGKTRDP